MLIRLPLSREVLLLLASVQRKELRDGLEKQELPSLRPNSQELTEELLERSKTEIDSSRRSQMPRRLVLLRLERARLSRLLQQELEDLKES